MKTVIIYVNRIIWICGLILLTSCGGGGSAAVAGGGASPVIVASNLRVDQSSPIPIVNGVPTKFDIYISNSGKGPIENLSWSIKEAATQNVSLFTKTKTWLTKLVAGSSKQLTSNDNAPITIVDSSGCTNIAALSTCHIVASANAPGGILLEGSDSNGTLIEAAIPSAYPFTPAYGGSADSLVLSRLPSLVTLQDGQGSNVFSVINNSTALIDVTNLLGTMPSGVNWQPVNCPNPLPAGGICEIRMTYVMTNITSINDIQVNLSLNGSVVNGDGSKTPLPVQNSNGMIVVTNAKLGNLHAAYLGLNLNGNNTTSGNSTIGYIKNVGTGRADIGSLSVANSAFSFSNDNCSNKALNQGEVCSYIVTANVGGINQAGHTVITVPYNDGVSDHQSSTGLNYSYVAVIPPANPAISLTTVSALNQITLSGDITVTNTGNVPLSNLNMPILSRNTNLQVDDDNNHCTSKTTTLSVGASCNYRITYNPQFPSEDTSTIVSGLTARYIDPRDGNSKPISFVNSTGINISSVFMGHLIIGSASLNAAESNANIVVTNDGNYKAKVSNIAITPAIGPVQFQLNGLTACTNSIELKPAESCVIYAYLANLNPGSGNSILNITYNDNNGATNATANNNINWIIGNTANLSIAFSSNSLTTVAGTPVTTTLTLTNNGNVSLNNVQLPTLSNTSLSYISGGSCDLSGQQLNNQTLTTSAPTNSCTVVLQYSPVLAEPQTVITVGAFTANNGSYISSVYGIDLAAIAPSAISASPASLSPTLNWTNSTSYGDSVTLTNVGTADATFSSITPNSSELSISSNTCTGTLARGDNCTFTVNGYYPVQTTSYSSNGSLTITYSDVGGSNIHSTILNVNATLAMQPLVTPALAISGILPSGITLDAPTTVNLTLTNNSSATNTGDGSVSVDRNSLTGSGFNVTNGGSVNVSAVLSTSGVVNACSESGGDIVLSPGASCNVDMILTASGTATANTPQVTIKPSYTYKVYTPSSVNPNDSSALDVASPLIGNITVFAPAAALAFNYNNNQTSIAVEQASTPNPATVTLTVTNVGSAAVTSLTMPTISGISFVADSSCNSLAVNATCEITINVSTDNVLTGNLSSGTVNFTDSYHPSAHSTNLSGFTYTVGAPSSPSISVGVSTSGYSSTGGNGLSPTTALLNPSNDIATGGSAGAFKLIITYNNTASAAAQNFTVIPNPPSNYELAENNCVGVNLELNGSCSVTYKLSNPGTAGTFNILSGVALDGNYTYRYGLQGQFNNSGSASMPNLLQVTSMQPTLSLTLVYNVLTATLSNWYLNAANNISFNSSDILVAANPLSCNVSISGGGGTCNSTVNPAGNTGYTNITASINAPNNEIITSLSQQYLNVIATTALPQTGQTPIAPVDVSAYPGADGYLHMGVPWAYVASGSVTPDPRFTVSSNNCEITDNLTGLVWLKDPQTTGSGLWSAALNIANSGTWCGQSAGNWRIPNVNETMSLVNYGANERNWLRSNGFTSINTGDNFWTSTTVPSSTNNAYVMSITSLIGLVISPNFSKTSSLGVWPVRDGNIAAPVKIWRTGQNSTSPISSPPPGSDGALMKGTPWPTPRFVAGANVSSNCMVDTVTGLMWPKNASAFSQTDWVNALSNSNNLVLCGYDDWRLANVNELLSLINYGVANTASWLNTQGFSGMVSAFFWVSTLPYDGTAVRIDISNGATPSLTGFNAASPWIPVRGGS